MWHGVMVSLRDQVEQLYEGARFMASNGGDLSWCPLHEEKALNIDLVLPNNVSVLSETYRQLVRVRLHLDDLVIGIARHVKDEPLPLSDLVHLYWSLAVLRLFDIGLVTFIQKSIRECTTSGSSTPPTSEEAIMLVWAEAMLLQENATVELEFDSLPDLSLRQLINLAFAHALIAKDVPLLKKLEVELTQGRKIAQESDPINFSYGNRAALFVNRALTESSVSLGEVWPAIRLPGNVRAKNINRPTWDYSFQLCLACHGAASRGIVVNPVVDGLFPLDVMYKAGGSKAAGSTQTNQQQKRFKILLEIPRPNTFTRQIGSGAVVGLDGYNKMARLLLAKRKYRILSITVTEWVELGGDVDAQVNYVKKRIKNATTQRRLFTGTEKCITDISNSESGEEYNSDMSY